MSPRRCKEADGWAAALEAGELDRSLRLRLADHLSQCDKCQRRAEGIACLAQLLRDERVVLSPHKRRALWARVDRELATRSAAEVPKPARRPRILWTAAVAGAAAVAATVVFLWFGVDRGRSGTHDPSDGRPTVATRSDDTAPSPVEGPTPPRHAEPDPSPPPQDNRDAVQGPWRVQSASSLVHARHGSVVAGDVLTGGDDLTVGDAGTALLVSTSTIMLVDPDTHVVLPRESTSTSVSLERGKISVLSVRGGHGAADGGRVCSVRAGEVLVKPLGTVFSVKVSPGAPPEVVVLEGRVEVSSGRQSVTLAAPSSLVWGQEPVALAGTARWRLVAGLEAATGVEGYAAARAPRPTHPRRIARPTLPRPPATLSRPPAMLPRPKATLSRPPAREGGAVGKKHPLSQDLPARIRTLERLLAAGRAKEVGRRARDLLNTPGALDDGAASALHSLMAEAFLRGRKFDQACKAYLDAWERDSATTRGMDALHSAGFIYLEKLNNPARAAQLLGRYIDRYPNGTQREGSYYLLHQALTRSGRDVDAARIAARYLSEYPSGQFVRSMTSR